MRSKLECNKLVNQLKKGNLIMNKNMTNQMLSSFNEYCEIDVCLKECLELSLKVMKTALGVSRMLGLSDPTIRSLMKQLSVQANQSNSLTPRMSIGEFKKGIIQQIRDNNQQWLWDLPENYAVHDVKWRKITINDVDTG